MSKLTVFDHPVISHKLGYFNAYGLRSYKRFKN